MGHRCRIRSLAAPALVALALLVAPGAASAAFPGSNGPIAFHSDRIAGNYDVFHMLSPQGLAVPIAQGTGEDYYATYSPDASQIAFVSTRDGDNEIFVMDPNGGGQTQLTHNTDDTDFWPAYTPNGKRLLFTRSDGNDFEIFSMRTDGSNQHPLTDDGRDERGPVVSPDGDTVAFFAPAPAPGGGTKFQIFVMRSDGTHIRQITHSDGAMGARDPDFAPDGRRLVFVDDDDQNNYDIWTVKPNGHGLDRVARTPGSEQGPVYSPNGRRILFDAFDLVDANFEIYFMHRDGSHRTALTNDQGVDAGADWGVG
jgi:TolB protein